ncbi:Uncharacterized protein APZ42_031004 [Daphnia magna]|uniref:Uncharacterized protein n=1 Tax=Daphnia magna TaxID=35525 RepID=A0A0P5ZZ50_9CRUS|nr:Uncharacterized protein APZ42_031004 [Daphnia magna]
MPVLSVSPFVFRRLSLSFYFFHVKEFLNKLREREEIRSQRHSRRCFLSKLGAPCFGLLSLGHLVLMRFFCFFLTGTDVKASRLNLHLASTIFWDLFRRAPVPSS